MKTVKKSLFVVLALITIASAGLAYIASDPSVLGSLSSSSPAVMTTGGNPSSSASASSERLTIQATAVQDKILKGSDGRISIALTLKAADVPQSGNRAAEPADFVIVLDRSGSMAGQKLGDARLAVTQLIDRLSSEDRLALITYSNTVQTVSPLVGLTEAVRGGLKKAVSMVTAEGGTNLGAGLKQGIRTLVETPADSRRRRVILISDGLANIGIVDPVELGTMASNAAEHNFVVSTIGVGYDFNETLMTRLADQGAGRYYFLEDPARFAQVFEKEFHDTRNVAISGVEIMVPLGNGIRLLNAGGYPIRVQDGQALIQPGDLLSGQQRNLYLTFQAPTDREQELTIGTVEARFRHHGEPHKITIPRQLTVACVKSNTEVMASIDPPAWSARVLQEDYGQLKEGVAEAIAKGEKDAAMEQIREYESRNRSINATVGSALVDKNLSTDVQALRQSVEDTFRGAPAVVEEKKKQSAKALQYESYQIRRDKK